MPDRGTFSRSDGVFEMQGWGNVKPTAAVQAFSLVLE